MVEEDFPFWHPHVTLARLLSPETVKMIWAYVSGLEKPNYFLPFDNVTLFRSKGEREWDIEEMYTFRG